MDLTIIKLIRRIYISGCIAIGVISPIVCYFLLPEFNIKQHPLSYFGIVERTNLFWQISLILISIGLYVNGSRRIDELIKKAAWNTDEVKPTIGIICLQSHSFLFIIFLFLYSVWFVH